MAERCGRAGPREEPIAHVIRRARERYDVELKHNDVRQMERDILAGKSVFMTNLAGDTEKHLVEVSEVVVMAVWQRSREFVVTVLPRDDTNSRRHWKNKHPRAKNVRRWLRDEQQDVEDSLA